MSLQPITQPATRTREAFAEAMAAFRLSEGARIAVAVSGGADSVALLRLLAAWAPDQKIAVCALTVDHGLRDAAGAEAEQVGAWATAIGIAHTSLRWEGGRALRGQARSFQGDAREARYGLMTTWCAAQGYTHLFIGHHADDQVETFFLRLTRGSGVDGLSAMAPAARRGGIIIARPLLTFTKVQLLDFCRNIGQAWIEDPSNRNTASGRVRFRNARAMLAREGLTHERLLATIAHLQRARAALDESVAGLLASACVWDECGVATLHIPSILSAPEEIALRALSRVLMGAGGQFYGPRFEGLSRLFRSLKSGPWRDATLHGALVEREGEHLRILRESAQIAAETESGESSFIWDGRFHIRVTAHADFGPLVIKPLTMLLWRTIEEGAQGSPAGALPARARSTLPAIYDNNGLVAVPHARFVRHDATAHGFVATCISGSHATCDAEL